MRHLQRGACALLKSSMRGRTSSCVLRHLTFESLDEVPKSSSIRPRRIILVRHGESEGNKDERTYVNTADWKIPLTDKGKAQAEEAGAQIRELIGNDDSVYFYVSPYQRTLQTLDAIRKKLQLRSDQVWGIREEPRIAEQQFGNFQNVQDVRVAKQERKRFGQFFYRFPNGESGLDVYNRVSSFIATMFRETKTVHRKKQDVGRMNFVIVTHGLAVRLFLLRWFQISVSNFDATTNPKNCSLTVMERVYDESTGEQWYELTEESQKALNVFPENKSKST